MQPPSSQSAWEFLLVCADALVQKSLASAVQTMGGIAFFTSDTTSALAYFTRRKLDGIFIDARVGGALVLFANIRCGGSNRSSVIFACVSEGEEVSRLLNAGVNFVVHKPLDSHELETVLRNATEMIGNERQRYQRIRLRLPVLLHGGDKSHQAVTANISRGGMAVHCLERLAPGSAIHYVLSLPHVQPLRGRGELAWSNPEGLAGIRVYFMDDEFKHIL